MFHVKHHGRQGHHPVADTERGRPRGPTPLSASLVTEVVTSRPRQDDDETAGLDALGLRSKASSKDLVVHDLPLEGRHGVHLDLLPALSHLSDDAASDVDDLRPATRSVAGDVEHEPTPLPGLGLHGKPRELLQRFEDLAIRPDETAWNPSVLGVDDRDGGAVTVDVDVDVPDDVRDVEQGLEEVRSDVTLRLQRVPARLLGRRCLAVFG
jgi:hypothetical protein